MEDDNTAPDALKSWLHQSAFRFQWLAAILLLLLLAVLLFAPPNEVLRGTDLIGSAVCHRIESHSFSLAGRQLPLCARCTGTFVGALSGLVGQAVVLRRRRAAEFPPAILLVTLAGFTLLWAADGLNSYLALMGGPHLYEPRNALRLTTGALNGLSMSSLIYPVFNISFWRFPVDEPAVRNWGDLGILVGMEAVVVGLVLSRRDFLLYPLALLSAGGVLTLLTSVNTVIAMILTRRENSVDSWWQAKAPISLGLLLSLIQIVLIDLLRYLLTGTLDGIPPLQ
jgi:uncharacterized membrane protein